MFCVEAIGFKVVKSPPARVNARETPDQKQEYRLEGPNIYFIETVITHL